MIEEKDWVLVKQSDEEDMDYGDTVIDEIDEDRGWKKIDHNDYKNGNNKIIKKLIVIITIFESM